MGINEVILAIAILFPVLLIGKRITGIKFCVICAGVSLTWIGLLVLRFLDVTVDSVVLAMLMGESVVGIYYLLEKKVNERFHVFRLPALVTLTLIAYLMVNPGFYYPALFVVLTVWLVFGAMYSFREKPKIKESVRKVIECCKDW